MMNKQGPVFIEERCGCRVDHGIPYRCPAHQLGKPYQDLIRNLRLVEGNNPVPLTQYAIQNVATGLWFGPNYHWVERNHALRFDFMTTALAHATEMGFGLDTFTVEAV